jgi:hypothetical protein
MKKNSIFVSSLQEAILIYGVVAFLFVITAHTVNSAVQYRAIPHSGCCTPKSVITSCKEWVNSPLYLIT